MKSTEDIAGSVTYQDSFGNHVPANHQIPLSRSLELDEEEFPVDPYLLGIWIGDGTAGQATIATDFNNGDGDWLIEQFARNGYDCPSLSKKEGLHSFWARGFTQALRDLDVLHNKVIPRSCLWASYNQRLALLQGLMDSDGFIDCATRKVSFTSVREDHAKAVLFLARSLGQKPVLARHMKTEGYAGRSHYYTVSWCATINPFRLPRKMNRWKEAETVKQASVGSRSIVSCEPIVSKPMRCLTVDSPNSMYLCGEALIPTHNAVVAALLDEVAFFQAENSANPDKEIVEAIRPAMATVPGAMLFGLSSPYAQRGVLYDAYKNYFGQDEDSVMVWQAPTWYMNPTIPDDFFRRAYSRDPASASAEYGAEFRKDTDAFIPEDAFDANVDEGVYERPYTSKCDPYFAFVDPSGGSRDSFTLAIAHVDPDSPEEYSYKVLDLVREFTPPFSPDDVVKEMAVILKSYGISEVVGDRYSGEWVVERFDQHGITYTTSALTKSDLYKAVLPDLMSQRALLIENERMRVQFLQLERKAAGHGRDLIDHPRGGHDDIANAVAGALVTLFALGEVFLADSTGEMGIDADLFEDFVTPDGRLDIVIQCAEPGQYLGMAQADLYIKAQEGSFRLNFVKGYAGIWMQMFLVICFGVMFSTILNGPVAMMTTLGALVLGFNRSFIMDVATGQAAGGGPMESVIRILTQQNVTLELDPTATVQTAQSLDLVFRGVMWVTVHLLPDFSSFQKLYDHVSYGYDISFDLFAQQLLITLSYGLIVVLVSYFLFRSKEVAG